MTLLTWNDSYSVTVSEMDEQHKKLFGYINDLYDAMTQGKGKEILGGILDGLVDYTKTHFSKEEEYMEKFNYIGLAEQQMKHRAFVDKLAEFQKEFNDGNKSISIEIMNFLKDWLVDHIQGIDKKYGECFHEHGL